MGERIAAVVAVLLFACLGCKPEREANPIMIEGGLKPMVFEGNIVIKDDEPPREVWLYHVDPKTGHGMACRKPCAISERRVDGLGDGAGE